MPTDFAGEHAAHVWMNHEVDHSVSHRSVGSRHNRLCALFFVRTGTATAGCRTAGSTALHQ